MKNKVYAVQETGWFDGVYKYDELCVDKVYLYEKHAVTALRELLESKLDENHTLISYYKDGKDYYTIEESWIFDKNENKDEIPTPESLWNDECSDWYYINEIEIY